jgi:hypothetical protein
MCTACMTLSHSSTRDISLNEKHVCTVNHIWPREQGSVGGQNAAMMHVQGDLMTEMMYVQGDLMTEMMYVQGDLMTESSLELVNNMELVNASDVVIEIDDMDVPRHESMVHDVRTSLKKRWRRSREVLHRASACKTLRLQRRLQWRRSQGS